MTVVMVVAFQVQERFEKVKRKQEQTPFSEEGEGVLGRGKSGGVKNVALEERRNHFPLLSSRACSVYMYVDMMACDRCGIEMSWGSRFGEPHSEAGGGRGGGKEETEREKKGEEGEEEVCVGGRSDLPCCSALFLENV